MPEQNLRPLPAPPEMIQKDPRQLVLPQDQILVRLLRRHGAVDLEDGLPADLPPRELGAGHADLAAVVQDAGAVELLHRDGVVDGGAGGVLDRGEGFEDGGADAGFGEAEADEEADGASADLYTSNCY